MKGCYVIIFISQNRNPNFPQTLAATINLHGSRHLSRQSRRSSEQRHHATVAPHASEPRRPPLHHAAAAQFTDLAPSWVAPPFSHCTCSEPVMATTPETTLRNHHQRISIAAPHTTWTKHRGSEAFLHFAHHPWKPPRVLLPASVQPPLQHRVAPLTQQRIRSPIPHLRAWFESTVPPPPSSPQRTSLAPSAPTPTRGEEKPPLSPEQSQQQPRICTFTSEQRSHHIRTVTTPPSLRAVTVRRSSTNSVAVAPPWTSQCRQQRSSRHCHLHCHLHLHCTCRNPNYGERKCTATCQATIGQSNWSTGQLWSNGQSQQSTLVKTAKMVK